MLGPIYSLYKQNTFTLQTKYIHFTKYINFTNKIHGSLNIFYYSLPKSRKGVMIYLNPAKGTEVYNLKIKLKMLYYVLRFANVYWYIH